MQNQTPAIEISNVSRTFGKLKAVDSVSLRVQKGEFVGLLGPNGAGKTTLVEMIEGIQKPDNGEIIILGRDMKSDRDYLKSRIGLSLQETRFIDKLKVSETMNLFASFYGIGKARAAEVIEMVNLTGKSNSYTVNLSGGQRQRLAIGIALLNRPEIILLDEPTTGLDPHARREIWDLLTELKQSGSTLILTTHYMEEAEYLCERIVMMNRGRVLADGSLNDLLTRESGSEFIEFEYSAARLPAAVKKLPGLVNIEFNKDSGRARLTCDHATDVLLNLLKILNEKKIESVQIRKRNLDDLFISMTGRHIDE